MAVHDKLLKTILQQKTNHLTYFIKDTKTHNTMAARKFYLTSLLALLCAVMGYAQEVTLDFTKTWTAETSTTYTLDGYTIKVSGGSYFSNYGGEHYLMLKGSGASLTLPAFDFDVEKIEVVGRSGASASVTQNVFVSTNTKAVSTETTGAKTTNTYLIDENYQKAGTIYIIKVTNSGNSQMDAVRIFKKGSTATKTATTTSFESDAVTVEEGGSFAGQQATVAPEGVEGTLTYTSSNTSVATVDKSTGSVTLVDGGTTVITATFTPSDTETYESSSASYTLIYNVRKTTALAFAKSTDTANFSASYQLPALTLKAGNTTLTGKTITYSSSDENVATVDASGNVTLVGLGTTTITASFAGDDSYLPSSATLSLSVVNTTLATVTFDASLASDKTKEDSITKDGVTMAHEKDKGNFNLADDYYSIYIGRNVTFSTDKGYIVKIEITPFTTSGNFNFTGDGYKSTSKSGTWTGKAKFVTLTSDSSKPYTQYSKVVVTISYIEDIMLSENEDNSTTIANALNKVSNVTVGRTLTGDGGWYTLCLPFSVDASGLSVLKDAELMVFDEMRDDGKVMTFKKATSIEAGCAYLVLPKEGTTITTPVFKEVVISAEHPAEGSGDYAFVGIYSPKTLATDGTNLFLGANNVIYKPTATDATLKGLRAYFSVPQGADATKMSVDVSGVALSISDIHGQTLTDGKVYTLQGQYVGRSTKGLPRGIYVVEGRKVVVR